MKKIITIIVFFALCGSLFSAPITSDEASRVCRNFLQQKAANGEIANIDYIFYKTEYLGEVPVFHIFKLKDVGFITVAASDNFEPIVAYSFESDYLPNQASSFLMNAYAQWIVECEKESVAYAGAKAQWQHYLSTDFVAVPRRTEVVTPLVTTRWNQDKFFNTYCPFDVRGPDQHVYTGCVATAMSQIMSYHGHPRTGLLGSSFIPAPYGRITVFFRDHIYNYAAHTNRPKNYSNEMAKLMYHCGVSVQMGYTPTGSGAHSVEAMSAMSRHFKYDSAWLCSRALFDGIDQWRNALKVELNARRPVYYSANDGQSGHAFILDGYDEDSRFHINWGWGGAADGYYAVVDNYIEDSEQNPGHQMGFILDADAGRLVYPITDAPGVATGHNRNTAATGTIRSNEPTKHYTANTNCSWMLAAPEASRYNLTFDRLETEPTYDVVTIYNGPTAESGVAATFSGYTRPTETITVNADSVLVTFTTNAENQSYGFQISYNTISAEQYCAETVNITNTGTTIITDESGDAPYRNNSVCSWIIKPNDMRHCYFSFPQMELGNGDFIEIYNATTTPNQLLYRFDNQNFPTQDVIDCAYGKLKVRFVADNWDVSNGFTMSVEPVTAINDYAGINNLSLYPNPATDKVKIHFETNGSNNVSYQLVDMSGKILYNKQLSCNSGAIDETIHVANLAKGIYFLRLQTELGTTIEKFVKE